MSDTPRMNLALRKAQENCTESYLLTEGLKLERELNAANSIIRQQQLLDEENLRLQDRIKRLEREIELFREHVDYGDVCLVEAILKGEEIGRKEKEAKP